MKVSKVGGERVHEFNQKLRRRLMSCQVVSCRVMLCQVVSCRVMSRHVVSSRVASCHVVSCHVVSCRVMSCHVVSCRVVSCRVVSCHVVSCRVMSCHVNPLDRTKPGKLEETEPNPVQKLKPIETIILRGYPNHYKDNKSKRKFKCQPFETQKTPSH